MATNPTKWHQNWTIGSFQTRTILDLLKLPQIPLQSLVDDGVHCADNVKPSALILTHVSAYWARDQDSAWMPNAVVISFVPVQMPFRAS